MKIEIAHLNVEIYKQLLKYSQSKKVFIGKNKSRFEGSQLTQLSGVCEYVVNLTANELNGVTDEEFKEKCKQAQFG